MKKINNSNLNGWIAEAFVAFKTMSDWNVIFRSQHSSDIGIDGEIELLEKSKNKLISTGKIIKVQIKGCKSSESLKIKKDKYGEYYTYNLKTKDLHYYNQFKFYPIILAFVNLKASPPTLTWRRANHFYFDYTTIKKNQKRKTVKIYLANDLNKNNKFSLEETIHFVDLVNEYLNIHNSINRWIQHLRTGSRHPNKISRKKYLKTIKLIETFLDNMQSLVRLDSIIENDLSRLNGQIDYNDFENIANRLYLKTKNEISEVKNIYET